MNRRILFAFFSLALVFLVSACGGGSSELTYKVMGTASQAKVTFNNADNETETETVALPWETTVDIGGNFDFDVSVENGSESGSVTCEIWINGNRVNGTSGVRVVECSGSFKGSKNSYSWDYRGRYDAKPEDALASSDEQGTPKATSAAISSPTPKATPAAPAATMAPITGFDTYEHDMDCSGYNDELKLRTFSVLYPSGSVIKDCSDTPDNYVQFEYGPGANPEDAALVIALGRFNLAPPDPAKYRTEGLRLLTSMSGQMEKQSGAEVLETSSLVYQGENLHSRDLVAEVEGTQRLIRLVLIPNFEHGHGLFFLAMQKISGTPEEEMPEFDRVARKVIESVEFAPVETRIGDITFASQLTADDEPADPATTFPAGTRRVYGVFDYADIYTGMSFGFAWQRDGTTIYTDTVAWGSDPSSGTTWVNLDNDEGLGAGNYVLQLFVDGALLQTGSFAIEGTSASEAEATARYQEGLQRYQEGDYEGAIAAFSQAIELAPDYAIAYNDRGVAFLMLGEYERAVADYGQAIALNPNYALAYNNLGWAYYRLNKYPQALSNLNQAIELDPDSSQAYYNRARVYEARRELEKAIADYGQCIAVDPDNTGRVSTAYLNRGFLYAQQGEFEDAIDDYTQAISLAPDWDVAYLDRGLAYANTGDTKGAVADLRKVLEISNNPDVRQMAEDKLAELGVEP
jgi:tetratricopeptide (TPR) repeat protein